MSDLKMELHGKLRVGRATLLAKLDGLSEYDMRRPMTPTGTNLLGLVKHLAGVEYVYLGDSFDRPAPETLSWNEDGSVWDGADMWVKPDETSEYIIGLYERACAHGDTTLEELDLDSPGSVPHWPEERRATTLGVLLIRMVTETAQHAGHADIVRELIDGQAGNDANFAGDVDWPEYLSSVQRAAESFLPPT
jgi:Protein of unknown function (DUF664)